MRNQPLTNQRPSKSPSVVRTIAWTGLVIAVVVGIFYASHSEQPIPCEPGNTAIVFAHDQEGAQTLIGEAIRTMGVDPSRVTNILSAADQAKLGVIQLGEPITVCLDNEKTRVANVNRVQILG